MNDGQPVPGWYPDPQGKNGDLRWWDGGRWTDRTNSVGQALPAEGWYADPGGQDALRWWDGLRWTEQLRQHPQDVNAEPSLLTPAQARALARSPATVGKESHHAPEDDNIADDPGEPVRPSIAAVYRQQAQRSAEAARSALKLAEGEPPSLDRLRTIAIISTVAAGLCALVCLIIAGAVGVIALLGVAGSGLAAWYIYHQLRQYYKPYQDMDDMVGYLDRLQRAVTEAGDEVERYQQQSRSLQASVEEKAASLKDLQQTVGLYEEQADLLESNDALRREQEKEERKLVKIAETVGLVGTYKQIASKIRKAKKELSVYEEAVELLDVAFYRKRYSFIDSERYRNELQETRDKQKKMVKDGKAVVYARQGKTDSKSRKLANNAITILLRAFNGECDSLVATVNYRNIDAYEKRIRSAYEKLNKLSETSHVTITEDYLDLRVLELYVAHECHLKKREEQEEQRELREQMREEEKAAREAERLQHDAEVKEQSFADALQDARVELEEASELQRQELEDKIAKLEESLAQARALKQRAISQAQLTRAGHVYVISNIGSFGKDVYKIGLTRRVIPEERVKELGDASVPFPFDIHAMIYSNDAPTLEKLLHREFADRRVNMVNERREFFRVSIQEIEKAIARVQKVHPEMDSSFEITHAAEAEQYAQSLALVRETETGSSS